MPAGMSDNTSDRMPAQMPEIILDKTSDRSQNTCQIECQDTSDRMPARMSDRMPQRMSEYVPECMSDRMSENVSNIMSVGGDHSKNVAWISNHPPLSEAVYPSPEIGSIDMS